MPIAAPTAAVMAMAIAPHKHTRLAPLMGLAPPVRAAIPPSRASEMSDAVQTAGIIMAVGLMSIAARGRIAPAENTLVARNETQQ